MPHYTNLNKSTITNPNENICMWRLFSNMLRLCENKAAANQILTSISLCLTCHCALA